ncbi:MAG: TlpA disulfide reductase family protein [Planctomycetia bacterium]|nr:TlpA disulfide reductase family protein [Planctomycetia bacterium]
MATRQDTFSGAGGLGKVFCGAVMLFVGCNKPPLSISSTAPESAVVGFENQESHESRAVALELVDYDGLMARVALQRGKIVVLDCWSTACPPCVKEFPQLVARQKKWGDAVVCLSLSFDYEGVGTPEDVVPRVQGFLESVKATHIINLLTRIDADTLYGQLDLVSVPAVYVWGPDGTLAQRFDEDDAAKRLGRSFTYDDVEAVVLSLLAWKNHK